MPCLHVAAAHAGTLWLHCYLPHQDHHQRCADSNRALQMRDDLTKAGLANVTATYINLLGYTAPDVYEPTLLKL